MAIERNRGGGTAVRVGRSKGGGVGGVGGGGGAEWVNEARVVVGVEMEVGGGGEVGDGWGGAPGGREVGGVGRGEGREACLGVELCMEGYEGQR